MVAEGDDVVLGDRPSSSCDVGTALKELLELGLQKERIKEAEALPEEMGHHVALCAYRRVRKVGVVEAVSIHHEVLAHVRKRGACVEIGVGDVVVLGADVRRERTQNRTSERADVARLKRKARVDEWRQQDLVLLKDARERVSVGQVGLEQRRHRSRVFDGLVVRETRECCSRSTPLAGRVMAAAARKALECGEVGQQCLHEEHVERVEPRV
eukprot:Amastigsp_a339284_112.p3 type:complete len:212 gc:universal Amastigsp_a339284_112:1127-1762(+)